MHGKLFSFVLTLLVSAVGVSAANLQVVSATPQGENVSGGRNPVSVTFNQPVAALGEKSTFSSEDCPLAVLPAVPGTCRFIGTQTLQFEPAEDWTPATEYTFTLPGSFTSRVDGKTLGDNFVWSFVTPRPEIERVVPFDREQFVNVHPKIYVTVSQSVNLSSAQTAVHLTYQRQDIPQPTRWERMKSYWLHRPLPSVSKTAQVPVSIRPLTEQEYKQDYSYVPRDHVFVIEPKEALPVHSQITLTITPALRATAGDLGPLQGFTSVFYTYPKLEIAGGNLEGCLPLQAQLAFTSPVRLGELLEHLTVSPSTALVTTSGLEAQSVGYQEYVPDDVKEQLENYSPVALSSGTGYFMMPLSFVRLAPEETVTLTIDKDLADIYGQKLGSTQYITLKNSGYCPAAVFKGGTGVLESYLPPYHPIDLMNEPKLDVQAGRFGKTDFIPFFKKSRHYCKTKKIAKENLQYDGAYPFDITPNQTKKTFLDLSKFNPTARKSIIYSQVRIPSKYQADGDCWQAATDNITDLGVTLKTSRDQILVWVTSLQDGTPKAHAQVELRNEENEILWTGTTNENGVALAPGREELALHGKDRWTRPVVYAFVSSENGDAVLASDWNDGLEPWRFNVNFDYSPQETGLVTALFTERGIYRPGEKVYVKGITRRQKDGQWTLPRLQKGTWRIFNSRREEIARHTVKYGKQGEFDFSFDLPTDAVTGVWQIHFETEHAETETDYSFRVEAVKQADFAVHLRAEKGAYVSGETARFTASADYLFGAPVAGGRIRWTLRRSNDWFHPSGYEGYEFMPYFLVRDEGENDTLLAQSSGKLNAQGQINFTETLPKVTRRQSIYAEAGVQTPTGQQLFARTQATLNPADFYLGSYMERWTVEKGEQVTARIVAVGLDGKAVGPVKVKANVQKEEYLSVRKTGLSGRLEWVSERRTKNILRQTFTVPETGADFSFLPAEPGNYQITLSAKDKKGHEVRGGFEVTVYGKGDAYWKQNDDDILILKQDKDLYNPGETARILVESPYEQATALVTVERAGILEHWVRSISGGADYIEIPVRAEYVPNVFVSVTLVRGRAEQPSYDKDGLDLAKPQGKTGYAQLRVSQKEREIRTGVSTDKKHYLPGEKVTVKLDTSIEGKPVAADVTVMVVDEGILALTGYQVPNLMDIFYAPQALSVSMADNRVFLIGQRNFGEKGENRGGGGSALHQLGGTDLRSHFEFTPYFNAQVKTDSQGQGTVTFNLPDNLTSFRVMAVSSTVQQFGAGQTDITVSKPIMLISKMPRFLRRGDNFQCSAVIYNYEDEKGEIILSAQASGALKLTSRTGKLRVAKGTAAQISWPCIALEAGEAEVTFAASTANAKDSVVVPISVKEVEKAQTLALYSATDEAQEQVLEKPEFVYEKADNKVLFALASTALLNVRGGISYLLTYPYDCLEQQMSKIAPLVTSAQLIKDFNIGNLEDYKKTVQTILDAIPTYQAPSGGLAYWPGAQPDPYVTAYALEMAQRAKQEGYKVPSAALEKAVAWLKEIFGTEQLQAYPYSAAENATVRAYAVYVLALYGQPLEAQFNTLYGQRNALSVPAQAYLLLAAQALHRPETVQKQLVKEILNQMQYGDQTVFFTAGETGQPWLHMSEVKVTALVLEALLKTKASFAKPYQVVKWLVQQLNAGGHWQNTSDNAAAFMALHTYYTLKETVVPDFMAQVSLNGEELFSAPFVGRSLRQREEQFSFKQVYEQAPQARVQLVKFGEGTLYYTLAQTYLPQSYTDEINAGFQVSRQVTDLYNRPVEEFHTGMRYKVTLKVRNAADYSFVALEDFIPAGFELVNTALATESKTEASTLDNAEWGSFGRDEKYDDRIVVFADFLSAGEHTYSYLLQATVTGTFSYPSVWASQMYDPAVFGRNATSQVVVQP